MFLLNIFLHSDGSFAWDVTSLIILALIAGWLLHQYAGRKAEDRNHKKALGEWDKKYRRLEGDYKNYKANIAAAEKNNDKTAGELQTRTRALEGDIRVLAEERNKIHGELLHKDEEIKRFARHVADTEDRIKAAMEKHHREMTESAAKYESLSAELARAKTWENRAGQAEAEAAKATAAIHQAERKKLEAELRLKSTAEYAGKVVPLESELAALQEKIKYLNQLSEELSITRAQLELEKQTNNTLKQELASRHMTQVSLTGELQALRDLANSKTTTVVLPNSISQPAGATDPAFTQGLPVGEPPMNRTSQTMQKSL